MTTEQLQAIQDRCDKASPGPWNTDGADVFAGKESLLSGWDDGSGWFDKEVDAEFCAAAREDVPALLAEIHRLQMEWDHLAEHVRSKLPEG